MLFCNPGHKTIPRIRKISFKEIPGLEEEKLNITMTCREKVLLILAPTPKYNPNLGQKTWDLIHMHETEDQGLDKGHLEVIKIFINILLRL